MILQYSQQNEAVNASREDPVLLANSYLCGAQLVDPDIGQLFDDSSESEESSAEYSNIQSGTEHGRLNELRKQRRKYNDPQEDDGDELERASWFYDRDSWWNTVALWMFGEDDTNQ